jgi:AcrR family transcriptional regulator
MHGQAKNMTPMSQPAEIQKPPHKRRNAPETKARIIESAQQLFAAHGYAQAGIREIATHAGVAVSLVPQHFGSKAELFEAALLEAMAASTVLDVPRDRLGRHLVDVVLNGGDMRLPAMVVLSTGDPDAREITARVTRDRIITDLAQRLGAPDARDRALEITMLATGFLIYARQLPVGEVSERTQTKFAQLLQAIVDES